MAKTHIAAAGENTALCGKIVDPSCKVDQSRSVCKKCFRLHVKEHNALVDVHMFLIETMNILHSTMNNRREEYLRMIGDVD